MASKAHRTSPSTKSKSDTGQVEKPYPNFPLTPHRGSRRWCKKIKGQLWYFGGFADGWEKALDTYKKQLPDIMTGRTPPAPTRIDGLRLIDLCNRFLHYKRSLIQTGELSLRTWDDYCQTCRRLTDVFGEDRLAVSFGPGDFEKLRTDFAKSWGPVRIKNEITRTRMVFGFAYKQELIEKPIKFGVAFEPPEKDVLRRHRARQKAKLGARMFEADELQRILAVADPCMKAMVLLAANGGMGNMDLAQLPTAAVDLGKGWLDFPRPKTGIDRKIPLWLETIEAVKAWKAVRPEPKHEDDAHLLFLTKQRLPWFRSGRFVEKDGEVEVKGIDNPLSKAFKWLMNRLDLNGKRGFYCIRHGFETIAGDTGDQVAVDAIMGHSDPSMAETYRERIDPARLRKVVEHVRQWLFPSTPADQK